MKSAWVKLFGALASLSLVVDWNAIAHDPKKAFGVILCGVFTVLAGTGRGAIIPSVENAQIILRDAVLKENDER